MAKNIVKVAEGTEAVVALPVIPVVTQQTAAIPEPAALTGTELVSGFYPVGPLTSKDLVEGFGMGKAKRPATQGTANRYTWEGISVAGLCRWLGANGYSMGQAKKVCAGLNLGCSPATISTQRQAGKQGQRGKLPQLTEAQQGKVKELAAIA